MDAQSRQGGSTSKTDEYPNHYYLRDTEIWMAYWASKAKKMKLKLNLTNS